MNNEEPKQYKISIGDRIIARVGAVNGLIGTVIKIYDNPISLDAGFDPKLQKLHDFAIGSNGMINYRLTPGEFTPVNKTLYSIPKAD